jgi:hypothetical protein
MVLSENSPVIFHFQPTDIKELSSPEELRRWEESMKSKVGFKAELSNLSGTCCESYCAGSADDCDSD